MLSESNKVELKSLLSLAISEKEGEVRDAKAILEDCPERGGQTFEDDGTRAEECDRAGIQIRNAQKRLMELNGRMHAIESGRFNGECSGCHGTISMEVLTAMPTADTCKHCNLSNMGENGAIGIGRAVYA